MTWYILTPFTDTLVAPVRSPSGLMMETVDVVGGPYLGET
jgi:hypothetical protein